MFGLAKDIENTPEKTGKDDVAEFLKKVAATPVQTPAGKDGRLIFAIDATASRQPTWDRASHLQHEMFEEAASIGGLALQVAFFRGFGEFKATKWTTDSQALIKPMSRVFCLGGHTQIEKVLKHALCGRLYGGGRGSALPPRRTAWDVAGTGFPLSGGV